ncbi:phage tailspike protein [Escherichia coli]|uniref:phage tailspike protein n=1 Tax=Escherichia coli TaxID=562 RepID=UPI00287A9AC5|nr:phage tailspike protein [Escherichia coli]MDS1602245.1 phage tailspike protein [Escherichia coli]MDS1640062.1 phage tailspike protein [Escherichia coli]
MTDITANVIVSMPSQLFTMARSFKAVANGKIYVGIPNTDPANPENQIQVYIENESGKKIPVPQPLIINSGGYPVYNGQIAKFLTDRNHSMAVYDAYGVQQFYFDSILNFDPYQLDASKIPVDGGGNLQQAIIIKTPQQFGAIGDGVTDDTVALQAAMDYCQIHNEKLAIPPGRYRITKPLLYRNQGFYNYEIEGQGGAAVIIMDSLEKTGITAPDAFGDDFNVNAAMVVLNDTNQSKYCRISGLRFESPVGAEYAIYVGQAENTYIHDCFWTGFTFGWYDLGSWVTRVERCIARDIVDTGFFKKNGTSTYIAECYADRMMRGYYLGGGYSAIINCACDLTTRWGFYLYGGRTGSDLATFSIKGCGSEQSGTDSVFYVDGLVALSIEDHHAGNDPAVQASPAALLSMASNTSYSQVVLKNIRTVNVDTLILDAADHNYFDLTNVTCRSAMSKEFYLGSNSRVLKRTYDGTRFITSTDQVGIGFAESDIVDGWTDLSLSGLRNGQFVIRKTITINRTSGDAGFALVMLPFNMNTNYVVVANLEADFATLQAICPSYSVTEKMESSFKLCASSAKNNTSWSSIDVEIIIYGLKS